MKYLCIYPENPELQKYKNVFIDKDKKRIIINESMTKKLKDKFKIESVEEYPTYDRIEIEKWQIN